MLIIPEAILAFEAGYVAYVSLSSLGSVGHGCSFSPKVEGRFKACTLYPPL